MLASSIVLGIALGIASGGDWRRLGLLHLRWWGLLLGAVALRVAGLLLPLDLLLYLAAIGAVGLVAAINYRLPGALAIAVGTGLNVVVIALNGGMPVDAAVARDADALAFASDRLHIALTADTRLPFLADIIPLRIFRNVYSLGDLVIAAGAFWLPFAWLRRR